MRKLKTWWNATRLPFAFPTSLIPALLGGLVAVIHGGVHISVLAYVLTVMGAIAVHGAANLLNDYLDFRKGVDRPKLEGASRGVIVSGLMTPRAVLIEAVVLWGISAIFAAYFLLTVGTVLIPVILLGGLLAAGYTAAPTQFKYRALGDVSVFLAFGVGITVGSYVVQTGQFAWAPVFYSIPVGLLIWAILHANNLRDMETDRHASITTMAILLGAKRSRNLYVALLALAYCSLLILALARLIVPTALLPLLTIPLAVGAIRQMKTRNLAAETGNSRPSVTPSQQTGLANLDMRTAQLEMAFGVLLLLGLLARIVF